MAKVYVLTLFFLRELFYSGPVSHDDDTRRSLSRILAISISCGAILPPFLWGLQWSLVEVVLSCAYLFILGFGLFLWDNMSLSGQTQIILSPVINGSVVLILSKLFAHIVLVLLLGLAFIIPSGLWLSNSIALSAGLSHFSFFFSFVVHGLSLLWMAYFFIAVLKTMTQLLPRSLSRPFSVIARMLVLLLIIFYIVSPGEAFRALFGSTDSEAPLLPAWPVIWFLSGLKGIFSVEGAKLFRWANTGFLLAGLLPVLFFVLSWLALLKGQANPETKSKAFGKNLWPLRNLDALSTFFLKTFYRGQLLPKLLISFAIPLGLTLFLTLLEIKARGHAPFFWPKAFSSNVFSIWILWLCAFLSWQATRSINYNGSWAFQTLPQKGFLGRIRHAFFKSLGLSLWLFLSPFFCLILWTHPFIFAAKLIISGLMMALFISSIFCRQLRHIPFTARLIPDPWRFTKYSYAYFFGFIVLDVLLSVFLYRMTHASWWAWALAQCLSGALTLVVTRHFKNNPDQSPIYLEEPEPLIMSLKDHL